MSSVYVFAASCVFLLLGVIWQKSDLLNLLFKIGLIGLAVWGFVLRFGVHL